MQSDPTAGFRLLSDMRLTFTYLTIPAVFVFHAITATADPSSAPEITISRCPFVSAAEVERILRIELSDIGKRKEEPVDAPAAVRFTCTATGITIETTSRKTGSVRTRRIGRQQNPTEGTERLMAIAAAELILSGRDAIPDAEETTAEETTESTSSPPEAPDKIAKPPRGKVAHRRTTDTGRRRFRAALDIAALWRFYFPGSSHLFGGGLGVFAALPAHLYLALDAGAAGGRSRRTGGDVSLLSADGALCLGWTGGLGSSPFELSLGAGYEGGWGKLRGRPNRTPVEGGDVSGGFGGPMLQLLVATRGKLGLGLRVEGGYAFFGNTGHAAGDESVELKGPWISVRVDFRYFFKR